MNKIIRNKMIRSQSRDKPGIRAGKAQKVQAHLSTFFSVYWWLENEIADEAKVALGLLAKLATLSSGSGSLMCRPTPMESKLASFQA